MALIEHLYHDKWKENLDQFFKIALKVLAEDRFAHCGSSVDDIRCCLVRGGVARFKEVVKDQMESLHLDEALIQDVLSEIDVLVKTHRGELLNLIKNGTIASHEKDFMASLGLGEVDVEEMLRRIIGGERMFEEWMYALGYKKQDILKIYLLIDDFLVKNKIIETPGDLSHLR